MKVERFIKEYANFKKKEIKNSEFINEENKEKAFFEINNVLKFKEKGMITVYEAIKIITNSY